MATPGRELIQLNPSRSGSQDFSNLLSATFKNVWKRFSINPEISTFITNSADSAGSEQLSYVLEIKEISGKYNLHLGCLSRVESVINHATDLLLSKVCRWNVVDTCLNSSNGQSANSECLLETLCGTVTAGSLNKLFIASQLLCIDDIFFNGRKMTVGRNLSVEMDEKAFLLEKRTPLRRKIIINKPSRNYLLPKVDDHSEVILETRKLKYGANYRTNPRYRKTLGLQGCKAIFESEPCNVSFGFYEIGRVYEVKIKIRNVSQISRPLRFLPPRTKYFSVSNCKFPASTKNFVASGMSVHLTLQFQPDSLGPFEDELVIECDHTLEPLVIPIRSQKVQPKLCYPNPFCVGECLVAGEKHVEFHVENQNAFSGARGRFILMGQEEFTRYETQGLNQFEHFWPSSENTQQLEIGAFTISPIAFQLDPLETTALNVWFRPFEVGRQIVKCVLVCDHGKNDELVVEGIGEEMAILVKSIDGLDADSDLKVFRRTAHTPSFISYLYQLPTQYPHTVSSRRLVIQNL
ncbi:unnamed protein product [Dicrocoelium dendriticum]|nr:unnamed protein product [Dicrocoelium dendriticum]